MLALVSSSLYSLNPLIPVMGTGFCSGRKCLPGPVPVNYPTYNPAGYLTCDNL